jgi:hypothetical protein
MKRITLLLLIALTCLASAQARKSKTLTKVLILKANRTGGANGTGVAWNPDKQLYYAGITGNTYFPMFAFNTDGKMVSDNLLETMFDVRGLWFNTSSRTLQTNGFKDFGLGEYKLDENGIPELVKKLKQSSFQPNEQSVGAYDSAANSIFYFDYNSSRIVKQALTGDSSSVELHLGVKKKKKIKQHQNTNERKNYNENSCIVSAGESTQVGLLNVKEKQIELYDLQTGLLKKRLKLPTDAPMENSLNVGYSNGIFWLFDKKKREWKGYQ